MDELLREFLTETSESLDVVGVELVRFEQDPNNAKILGNIFRLVHTIKGTCGFLALPRLEALTHAAEALMGNFRDGAPVTGEAVSLILATVDRIKQVLDDLERYHAELPGYDRDLIDRLERMAAETAAQVAAPGASRLRPGEPLRAGEVAPDELEPVFREASGPDDDASRPRVDRAGFARAQPPTRRARRRAPQGRGSLDPRRSRYARTTDDDGFRARADAQRARRDRAPA